MALTWLMRSSGTTDAGTMGRDPTITLDGLPRPIARSTRPRGRLAGRDVVVVDCDVAVVDGVVWLLLRALPVAPLVAVTVPSATDTAGLVYLLTEHAS